MKIKIQYIDEDDEMGRTAVVSGHDIETAVRNFKDFSVVDVTLFSVPDTAIDQEDGQDYRPVISIRLPGSVIEVQEIAS